jgi:hypothetical protein
MESFARSIKFQGFSFGIFEDRRDEDIQALLGAGKIF